MKTSNKILFGFVLFALVVQTTCIVIANNKSNEINKKTPEILKEVAMDRPISTLSIDADSWVDLHKSSENHITITSRGAKPEGNYNITFSNDTCYIHSSKDDWRDNILVKVNSNDIKNIIIRKANRTTVYGNYDSLFVDNWGSRFQISQNSHVNYLNIHGINRSDNELANIDFLDLDLRNAKINGENIKNLNTINLQDKSELIIKGIPTFTELKKDKNSKITFQ
ncbi:hypothetical protein DN752_02170 [Echinicola strongylocentroti]|uniref:Uncharacterized protein n=1 Tax=Echinicola strongylocentroti TaxID=1795355 RepID=A0A2Z4IEE1_9BACT|nr:hypothetical protein [Echinicola strongylocentroti]AWW29037.1 hypothetical protein DN752_02170 [Echinicola strongylocentroti]